MKTKILLTLSFVIFAACSSHHAKVMQNGEVQPPISSVIKEKINRESIEQHVSGWPEKSIAATKYMLDKYGLPTGVTDEMLIWDKTSPFKRSIVHKQNSKVLEEVIAYEGNPKNIQKLFKIQKDFKVDYSKQELSAYSDHEEENISFMKKASKFVKFPQTN